MEQTKKPSLRLQNLITGAAIVGGYLFVSGNFFSYRLAKENLEEYAIADVHKEHDGRLAFMVGDEDNPKAKEVFIRACVDINERLSKNYEVLYSYCEDRYNGVQAVRRVARDAWIENLACTPKIRDEPHVKIVECEDGSRLEKREVIDIFDYLIGEIGYRYAIREAHEKMK